MMTEEQATAETEPAPALIQVNAVAIDETAYYSISEEDKPFIVKIWSVYIYNADERTFCCEATPSFFMEYLYSYVEYQGEASEEDHERLTVKYCYEPTEDCYMHCWRVKGMTEQKDCGKYADMKEAREDLQSNWPL